MSWYNSHNWFLEEEISFLNRALYIVFPRRCYCCKDVVSAKVMICDNCAPKVHPVLPPTCIKCGLPTPLCHCGFYFKQRYVRGIAYPFFYESGIKEVIHNYKFNDKVHIKNFLVPPMLEIIREVFPLINFDVLTFVPVSSETLRTRGYNQSKLLADLIGEKLNIDVLNLLKKVRENSPQRELSARERAKNVEGVFGINSGFKDEFKNKTVLIVDDIHTTGSTLEECGKVLLENGAKEIYAVATAGTMKIQV